MNDALKSKEIIYGERADQLIFIPKERALELARIHEGLNTSKTWGEFKSRVPAHIYEEVLEMMQDEFDEDEENAAPELDSPFDPEDVPGYSDGDFPAWAAQEMLEWMPKDIQQKFGKIEASVFNDDFLGISPANEREIVAALKERGYRCVKDDDLIEKTYGG